MRKPRVWNTLGGRSSAFQEYLNRQTPERRAEILAGERSFMRAVDSTTGPRVAAAATFAETLRGPDRSFPVSRLLDRVI